MSAKKLLPYKLLRNDRDDQARAVIFDEWIFLQPLAVKSTLEWWLYQLVTDYNLSDTGAKSLLVSLIVYVSLQPDQQDLWDAHGEHVRAAFEWAEFFAPKVEA